MDKIKIRQAVIVEGKYDKIKISSFLDATIIETRGFRIFSDKEQMKLLRVLAQQQGLLVLTDSDHAGFMIRNYLAGSIPKEQIRHPTFWERKSARKHRLRKESWEWRGYLYQSFWILCGRRESWKILLRIEEERGKFPRRISLRTV